jgi:hypothetical protein
MQMNGSKEVRDMAPESKTVAVPEATDRRAVLRRLGRFAAVTPPVVVLLLAMRSKPAEAQVISIPASSRQLKSADGKLDDEAVLSGVAALAVERWRYKAETGLEQSEHIGPYAEDFRQIFGVGDGVTISTTDALGVCLAAIKALSARVETLEQELARRSSKGEVKPS